MGYTSLQVLKTLCPEFQFIYELVCGSCINGKHVCAAHPPRVIRRTPGIFDLLHLDVWCHCTVTFIFDSRYFVRFVDDFSCATWLFVIKSRQEIFVKFAMFISFVKI